MKKTIAVVALLLVLAGCRQDRWIINGVAAATCLDRNGTQFSAKVLEYAATHKSEYPIIFYGHEYDKPIGILLDAYYEDGMLFVEIEISQSQRKIWDLIKDGRLTGLSVGGVILDKEPFWNEVWQFDGQLIKNMMMVEISVVMIPANAKARILQWREE